MAWSVERTRIQMNPHQLVQAGYDQIAPHYLAWRDVAREDVRLLNELITRLANGAHVLDAGCGAGVPIAKRLSEQFRVTGADFSPAQIALARQLVPQAEFICQDLTALDFPDATFGAICSYYAIIHIPRTEHQRLLQNFYRWLKPSGWLLVCLGAEDLPEDIDENYFGTRMYWSHYDAETNRQLMLECGFVINFARLVPDDPGQHLFVLAQKPVP